MKTYSVTQIEQGIDFWRERMSAKARILADVYGKMIYEGLVSVESSSLSEAQCDALCVALEK